MLNKKRLLGIVVCVSSLSACSSYNSENDSYYQAYNPNNQGTVIYSENYDSRNYYPEMQQDSKPVVVPETYHVGAYHSPTPHANRDREWVSGQNPQSYTIELADDEKASRVANTLYNAPKKERMAEVKYERNGKTYYKGLYGSYPSYEAAQKALSELPADVKQKAGVKSWSSVQSGVTE